MSNFERFMTVLEDGFRADDLQVHHKAAELANVQRIQEVAQAIGQRDYVALAARLADDVKLEIRGHGITNFIRHAEGSDDVLRAIQHNFAQVQDQTTNVESVVAQGDLVVVQLREQGRDVAAQTDYDVCGIQHFRIRNGKIGVIQELSVPYA